MKKKFASIAYVIDERLESLFHDVFNNENYHPLFFPVPPLEINRELEALTLRGGKRLRPALMVAGYELYREGALQNAALLDAACAMELLQSYFLIHDDIMDGDPMRRGGPSVHSSLQRKTGHNELGMHLGILAGDLGCAFHEYLLSGLDCADDVYRRVQQIFSRMHMDVVMGQTLDLQGSASPREIVQRKTASYTTIGPLCLGAALGGADDEGLEQIAALARPLGIAFQYRDDIIGVFGDAGVAGKPVGSDLRNNKRTLLVEDAMTHLGAEDREALKGILRSKSLSDGDIERALTHIERSGARGRVEQRIEMLCGEVEKGIESLSGLESGKTFLRWLNRLLAFRET
jgi:geranylgeranyl diphosphate synthase, type I